jgi:hypothetical protein
MAKRGSVVARTRDCRGGRESREDIVAGVAETTVLGGGRGIRGEGVGRGNMGARRWVGESNGI